MNQPQGAPLERVESFQYPSGHLGHLSQAQGDALGNFRRLCEQKGYYTPAHDKQQASHDDETLLRYLRARKFIPQDAFGQFKDTEDWRKKNAIDELYESIDMSEYLETAKLYPQWTGRRDKRGIPVYVFEIAPLTSKRMSEYEKKMGASSASHSHVQDGVPPKLIRLFALYENLIRFTLPFCAALPDRPFSETPVSQSNNIVDISNVGLKQFWNLKDHMQLASQLATAHYPETLDRIFVIGAPSFFPTVWGWVKRWFDPITVSKIFILGPKEVTPTLSRYIDIDNIPRKYGGKLDWNWGSAAMLDKAADNALQWKQPGKDANGRNTFPGGPIKWRRTQNGDMVAIAVGSEHGKKRNDIVATLAAHERDLNLATVLSQEFGEPSTSGLHTHPTESDDYFSSAIPPDEPDESGLDPRVGRKNEELPTQAAATKVLPIREVGHSTRTNPPPREGTSTTKYMQQYGTHAEGQMAHGTPATLHHGYGDKTNTMESSTVGQAPKDVSVPEAQPDEQDNSYLGQAKAVASSAYSTATSAATTVLGTVGLAGTQEASDAHVTVGQHSRTSHEDPRINKMENKSVEEFIRHKYASHPDYGKGK